jgi:hypothetical protein
MISCPCSTRKEVADPLIGRFAQQFAWIAAEATRLSYASTLV